MLSPHATSEASATNIFLVYTINRECRNDLLAGLPKSRNTYFPVDRTMKITVTCNLEKEIRDMYQILWSVGSFRRQYTVVVSH